MATHNPNPVIDRLALLISSALANPSGPAETDDSGPFWLNYLVIDWNEPLSVSVEEFHRDESGRPACWYQPGVQVLQLPASYRAITPGEARELAYVLVNGGPTDGILEFLSANAVLAGDEVLAQFCDDIQEMLDEGSTPTEVARSLAGQYEVDDETTVVVTETAALRFINRYIEELKEEEGR